MELSHPDYRTVIKHSLTKRSSGGGHSLRALAEKIGVSNSFLSEVLNGRKSLSVELAFKIAVKLGFTDTETQRFCLLVQLDNENDPAFRTEIVRRLNSLCPTDQRYDLTADLFKLIADWHHFAILELTHVAGFEASATYIAAKLGISKTEAELALDRLVRLNLLEANPKGTLRKTHEVVSVSSAVPVEAFKQFHSQILEKAISALVTLLPRERVSATDIIPLDSQQLPTVDRLSQQFASEVLKLSAKAKIKDHVYALSVHCFPLTKKGPR